MKAVITSAGKGSRVGPIGTVLSKDLFPLFGIQNGKLVNLPLIDFILSDLSAAGFDEFCFVIGPGQRGALIKDYLNGKEGIQYVVQEEPRGFGDAILRAEKFVGDEPFAVHANDVKAIQGYRYMKNFYDLRTPDAILLLRKVDNPKRYGIVTGGDAGTFEGRRLLRVNGVEEKPENPKSSIAISAVYTFSPKIFSMIRRAPRHQKTGEIELTPGIQLMVEEGLSVYGVILDGSDMWLNTGDPKSYKKALDFTFSSSVLD